MAPIGKNKMAEPRRPQGIEVHTDADRSQRHRSRPKKGCLDYLTGKKLSNSEGWLEARLKLLVLARSHRPPTVGWPVYGRNDYGKRRNQFDEYAQRVDAGRLLPLGMGSGENRCLLRESPECYLRAADLVASGFPTYSMRYDRRFRYHDGPRNRAPNPQDPRCGASVGADPAGRTNGHVPLGPLFPQGMECSMRSCPRLQHGRVE